MAEIKDKAYYFTPLEFAVFMAAGGTEHLVGFEFPKQEDVGEKALVLALHSLIGNRMLQIESSGKSLILTPEGIKIYRIISETHICIDFEPQDKNLMQAVYYTAGKDTVLIENSGISGRGRKELRVSRISSAEILNDMDERLRTDLIPAKNRETADKLIHMNSAALAELEKLEQAAVNEIFGRLNVSGVPAGKSDCELLAHINFLNTVSGEKTGEIWLFRGALNNWVAYRDLEGTTEKENVQQRNGIKIEPDNAELRKEILLSVMEKQHDNS